MDGLLTHVKAKAYRHLLHCRPWDLPEGEAALASGFDEMCGSIAEALASGVLPARYFAPKESSTKVVQLMSVATPTYFIIGSVDGTEEEEFGEAASNSEEWAIRTALFVRRVACFALVEEDGRRHVEPLLYLMVKDLALMSARSRREGAETDYPHPRVNPDDYDPSYLKPYPHHKRLILASEFMESRPVRTCLLVDHGDDPAAEEQQRARLFTHLVEKEGAPPVPNQYSGEYPGGPW